MGIADIRAGFDSRQILYLDKDGDFDDLEVTDRGIADFSLDRGTIDFHLFEPREEGGESLLSGRQTRQSEGQATLARINVPLTGEETAVLEAIQDFRRRQDQYNAGPNRTGTESGGNSGSGTGGGSGGTGSGTGSRSPWAERATRPAEGPRRERTASVSRAVNEILDNIRDQRERIRDTHERLRTREDSNAERRRYAASPFSGLSIALGTAGSGTSGRGALVSRLLANTTNPTFSGGWDNVEALYDDPLPSGTQPPETTSLGNIDTGVHTDLMRRYRAAYLMREWEDSPARRVLGNLSSHSRPGPYDTAGLVWSDQGDIL